MAKDSEAAKTEERIPGIDHDPGSRERPASYSMIEPRLKNIYAQFYKATYFSEEKALDAKTQELIALGCSLVAKCDGCIEGHIKKALKEGATKEEISEAIVIAVGINAAAIVDMTDKAATSLGLNHFPSKASRKS
jgi:AhpD family alkylhydroperoxidase